MSDGRRRPPVSGAAQTTAFVPLRSLTTGTSASRKAALAAIRGIYFKTTKRTIEHDIAHAIELLKSLPTEEDREKATVYMEGLADMRREWARGARGRGRSRSVKSST